MLDIDTRLPVSDTNGSHPDKVYAQILGSFIVSNAVPEGTMILVPGITREVVYIEATEEVKEYFTWDSKQAAVVTNIQKDHE